MSKKRTLSCNDLTAGKVFLVRGKLLYSRLASQIEGEELIATNERKRLRGGMPVSRAYTEATVTDAQVIHQAEGESTPEETYGEESLYSGKHGTCYTATNKTQDLPYIVVARDGEDVADRVDLEGELANGLDATLVMRVFKSRSNQGISLDGVVLHEPIRYRQADGKRNDFETLNLKELALG